MVSDVMLEMLQTIITDFIITSAKVFALISFAISRLNWCKPPLPTFNVKPWWTCSSLCCEYSFSNSFCINWGKFDYVYFFGLSGNNLDQHCIKIDFFVLIVAMFYSVRQRIPFSMLSVSSLTALWTRRLLILRLNLLDISLVVNVVLVVLRHF